MSDLGTSCVPPAKGPSQTPASESGTSTTIPDTQIQKEKTLMNAQVGKPAPDFEANAFVAGAFKNVKLSDYKGK